MVKVIQDIGKRFWSFFQNGTSESMARLSLFASVLTGCSGFIILIIKGDLNWETGLACALLIIPTTVLKIVQKKYEVNLENN